MEARQVAIDESLAWGMLVTAGRIMIGRGAKVEMFVPSETTRPEIMARVLGRSGTLRAPTLRIGREYLVGYSEEMYRRFFGDSQGFFKGKETR